MRNFPGTSLGERSDTAGQLRTEFYCRFIAAFLPPSLPTPLPSSSYPPSPLVLRACSLPGQGSGLGQGGGLGGANSDTVFGPLGVSVFNDGRDKFAWLQGPSVCLETREEALVWGPVTPLRGVGNWSKRK